MFLACSSQLEEFSIPVTAAEAWTNNNHFNQCAQKYMLTGASLEILCEHNAQVSEAAKRHQVAESWRLIKLLVKDPLDILEDELNNEDDYPKGSQEATEHYPKGCQDTTDKDSELTDAAAAAAVVVRDDDSKCLQRTSRSRVSADVSVNESRTKRRGSSATSNQQPQVSNSRGKHSSAESRGAAGDTNNLSEDETEDGAYAENELTLPNIASVQMLTGGICNDFFGDTEIGGDLILENFVAAVNNTSNDHLRWELKSEAFEPRVNLNVEQLQEDDMDIKLGNDMDDDEDQEGKQGSSNKDPETGGAGLDQENAQTVIVEDQTSALLCVDTAFDQQMWAATPIIRDTLNHFAETGDVQTAISMFMVLRSLPEYKNLIDENVLEFWFASYIDLLQRFQLYNVATDLIKKCPLPSINQMSQQSTTVFSNCTKCNKALSRPQGSWWCERCRRTPNLCCLCQQIVKGLFAWCQGCAHGGHLKCLKVWYKRNTLCPTGCGHHCEYQ